MKPGIYSVTFTSADGHIGGGLLVVDHERVHGGDAGNVWRGRYERTGETVKARVEVINWSGRPHSLFGPLQNFLVDLAFTANGDDFSASGQVVDHATLTLSLTGRRKADLA